MSHISMCDEPPHRKNRIVDLARPPVLPSEAASPVALAVRASPAIPTVDATRKVRRDVIPDNRSCIGCMLVS
jgi:hypothetical protein